jgi:uncharacterized membrane protein
MSLLAHGGTGPAGGAFPPWEWHPATVHFPIAFVLGAVALDLYAWRRERADLARTATGLMAAGVITGVVAAATGALAFFTVPAHAAEAHTLMYWHLGLNAAALGLFAAVVSFRRRPEPPGAKVRVAGLLSAALLAAGGFLGGRIVYRGGAGVDPAILAPEVRGGHGHEEQPLAPRPENGDPHKGH